MTSPTPNQQRKPVVLLRPVPGRTVIHDLWAGTKLIVVAGIGVLLTFYPGWVPIGAVAALVLFAVWLARIPRGVLPSIPRWLWFMLLLGGVTAAFAGGSPVPSISSGSTSDWAGCSSSCESLHSRLCFSGSVAWSRGPPMSPRSRPPWRNSAGRCAVFRVPVDDWAVALALALRAFPMLIDEFRILYAARSLRPRQVLTTRRARWRRWAVEVVDLIAAAVIVALRRADEMGDAITARGGAGQISAAPTGPKLRDWLALSVVLAVCGAALALELTLLGTS